MGISLSHARYEEIKQIVVDLFVKHDVSCVPVAKTKITDQSDCVRQAR